MNNASESSLQFLSSAKGSASHRVSLQCGQIYSVISMLLIKHTLQVRLLLYRYTKLNW